MIKGHIQSALAISCPLVHHVFALSHQKTDTSASDTVKPTC